MASPKQILALFAAIVVAILPAFALAKEFIVGDDRGWTINFDYQAWAEVKEFHVGDKLVFQYPVGAHNVHRVNGTSFQDCVAPAGTNALATGNDVIVLTSPGRKWYICGVGKHCEVGGQKLVITVLPVESTSPAPAPAPLGVAPASSAVAVAASGLQALVAVVFLVTMAVMA